MRFGYKVKMEVKRKSFEKGIIYVLFSASFVSFFSLCIKLGLGQVSIWTMTFMRFFIPLLLSIPFLLFSGSFKKMWPLKNVKLQFYRSAVVVVGQMSMIYYLTRASLLDATLLWGTGPIFIPLILRLFYKQKILKVTWISIVISFIGIALIIKPDKGILDPFSIFGLISGLSMALSQILFGINTEKGDPGENLFYLFLFSSALSLVPYLVYREHYFALHLTAPGILAILGVALGTLGNQLFRGLAYKQASPALLTPFLYFSIILSGLFDWTIFHRTPDIFTVIGTVLFVGATVYKWAALRGKMA